MADSKYEIEIIVTGQDRGGTKVLDGIGGSMRRIGEFAAGGLLLKGVEALGGAITGAFTAPLGAALDLEAALDGVQAGMSISNAEIAELKALTNDLALDPQLKVSATEAAAAIDSLGRNGLGTTEILGGAAESVVLLSNATGGDFAQSADIASDVMAQFDIDASKMKGAVDGITAVTVASKFTIDDYGLALAQAGGVASEVGVEFDDFNGAIAATSPLFASGSDAGTSFKTFLQRLVPASGDAADALYELGIITEDGTNRFFDAEGQLRSMDEVVGVLHESLDGLSEQDRNRLLTQAFGTDAMRTAVGLANMTEQEFEELQATMAKTDSLESARIRVDNLAGDMDIFRGVVESLQVSMGERFIPVARRVTQWATEFLTDHSDELIEFAGNLADGMGVVADVASGTIDALGNIDDVLADLTPLIIGAGAAWLAYGVTSLPAATGGLLAVARVMPLVTALAAQQAVAVAAAAAPFVVLGAAVGSIAYIYHETNEMLDEGTEKLLANNAAWKESEAALAAWGEQNDFIKESTRSSMQAIEEQQQNLQKAMRILAEEQATNPFFTDEDFERGMEVLRAQRDELDRLTQAHQDQVAVLEVQEQRAELTGQAWGRYLEAQQLAEEQNISLNSAMRLTADQLEEINDTIESATEKGQAAFGKLAEAEAEFLIELEDRRLEHNETILGLQEELLGAESTAQAEAIQKKIDAEMESFQKEESEAALSHARQQAEQRAHLGQMLIDYINAMAVKDERYREKSAEMITAIAGEYGVQAEMSDVLFGEMLGDIDTYATEGGASISGLIQTMRDNEQAAADLKVKADALEKEYVMKLEADFASKIIDADEYARRLNAIPARVQTRLQLDTIITEIRQRGEEAKLNNINGGGDEYLRPQGRASGGPMFPGQVYRVWDTGGRPEMLMAMNQQAYMLNPDQTITAMGQLGMSDAGGSLSGGAAATSGGGVYVHNEIYVSNEVDEELLVQKIADMVYRRNG